MSPVAARSSDLIGACLAGCEALVHPTVADAGDRRRHARLVCSVFTCALVAALAFTVLLPGSIGPGATLFAISAILGLAAGVSLLVATTGSDRIAVPLSLAVAAGTLTLLLAAAGGLASPLVLFAAALLIEPAWVARTRAAVCKGAAFGLGVLAAQAWPGQAAFADAAPAAWHWILPAAYLLLVAGRLGDLSAARQVPQEPAAPLVEAIQAVVVEMTPEGDVLSVSGKARLLFGIEPDMLIGTGLFERINVADRVEYLCALADLRDGCRLRTVDVKLRVAQPRGEGAAEVTRSFAIELSAVSNTRFLAVLRDISELASLRLLAEERPHRAEVPDASKATFLASVSHELRTPLNAIIGFSDMLAHEMFGPFPDARQKEYATLIRDSGVHLLSVVNSILDVSRIEAGAYAIRAEPYRFRESVDLCQSMMTLQARAKQIDFTVQVPSVVGEIVADRRAVQQILINLISNAIKFTPEGGSVTLAATRVGSRLHLAVSDTGIGIAADDLERIGEPFTQVDNAYTRRFEGAGLGLSLVKGLVALHEGTMSIESAPGVGTTVSVTLPVDGPARWDRSEAACLRAPSRKDDADAPRRQTA